MRLTRRFLACFLVFALVFNPVFLEIALAQSASGQPADMGGAKNVEEYVQHLLDKNTEVQAIEEVTLSGVKKFCLGLGGVLDQGKWSYYNAKISEANQKIAQAKTDSWKSTRIAVQAAREHGTVTGGAGGMKADIQRTANAKAELQRSMIATGNSMLQLAQVLSMVSVALGVVAAICTATGVGAGVGAACGTLAKVFGIMSGTFKGTGESLKASGEKGATSDKDFFKALGNGALTVATDYAKGKVLDQVKVIGTGKVLKGAGYKVDFLDNIDPDLVPKSISTQQIKDTVKVMDSALKVPGLVRNTREIWRPTTTGSGGAGGGQGASVSGTTSSPVIPAYTPPSGNNTVSNVSFDVPDSVGNANPTEPAPTTLGESDGGFLLDEGGSGE